MNGTPSVDPNWDLIIERSAADGDLGYGKFVSKWSLDYYRARVTQVGFTGFQHVLDVGCGFGQWTAALAIENVAVTGIDIHKKRLETADALLKSLALEGASFTLGGAEQLPFEAESFDAVWCYGVMMFTDRHKVLGEFQRILKPGGRIYVCTNGRGWWLKLALENVIRNRNISKVAWTAFRTGQHTGMPNATDIADVRTILDPRQWTDIQAAAEGTLCGLSSKASPAYDATYLGFDCVIEFTATKRANQTLGTLDRAATTKSRIAQLVAKVDREQTYSMGDALRRFPMPRRVDDLVNNTNAPAVKIVSEMAAGVDRTAVLRMIFEQITRSATTDEARIKACITFAQKRFYHHFAGQPMMGPGRMMLDPLASLMFGACRCGNVARFLIDLFEVNGFSARLLGGACHTSAEVQLGDRWVLADASLYPPGIVPMNGSDQMLSIQEAAARPTLLDSSPSYLNYETQHIAAFQQEYPEAYARITHWLVEPLLPSVGFFGQEFAGDRQPGLVQRWRKAGDASDWEKDPDYGWYNIIEEAGTQGPLLPTVQRPSQVTSVRKDGDCIMWDHPPSNNHRALKYLVSVSADSRGWTYDKISIGSDFRIDGQMIETTAMTIPSELRGKNIFVTICAFATDTNQAFALPSAEFSL